MAKDFEQIGHKNLELLRFYVSKDIKKIDAKIQNNESDLLGYFIGSLVDILVIFMFEDVFSDLVSKYISSIPAYIFIKIFVIVLMIGMFIFISWSSRTIHDKIVKRNKVSGKSAYTNSEQQDMIDNFDNIACDGLLICQSYIYRYNQAQEEYIKDFYLYEIIHHLSKAASICNSIYTNPELYISAKNDQLLDSYRVNNFIIFSRNIVNFLTTEIPDNSGIPELDNDMTNLKELVNGWTIIS